MQYIKRRNHQPRRRRLQRPPQPGTKKDMGVAAPQPLPKHQLPNRHGGGATTTIAYPYPLPLLVT